MKPGILLTSVVMGFLIGLRADKNVFTDWWFWTAIIAVNICFAIQFSCGYNNGYNRGKKDALIDSQDKISRSKNSEL